MTKPVLHRVYLGLGSNLGNREANIRRAVRLIGERVGEVTRLSSFYETKPWGFESAHWFVNAAALCLTDKTPHDVLRLTQAIEQAMGRKQKTAPSATPTYHDRPIDIDILLYDDLTIDEPDLHVPHPLMKERPFVMVPLREIMEMRDVFCV